MVILCSSLSSRRRAPDPVRLVVGSGQRAVVERPTGGASRGAGRAWACARLFQNPRRGVVVAHSTIEPHLVSHSLRRPQKGSRYAPSRRDTGCGTAPGGGGRGKATGSNQAEVARGVGAFVAMVTLLKAAAREAWRPERRVPVTNALVTETGTPDAGAVGRLCVGRAHHRVSAGEQRQEELGEGRQRQGTRAQAGDVQRVKQPVATCGAPRNQSAANALCHSDIAEIGTRDRSRCPGMALCRA